MIVEYTKYSTFPRLLLDFSFSPESKDLPLAVLAVLSHYFSESVVTVGLLNGAKRPTTQAN